MEAIKKTLKYWVINDILSTDHNYSYLQLYKNYMYTHLSVFSSKFAIIISPIIFYRHEKQNK